MTTLKNVSVRLLSVLRGLLFFNPPRDRGGTKLLNDINSCLKQCINKHKNCPKVEIYFQFEEETVWHNSNKIKSHTTIYSVIDWKTNDINHLSENVVNIDLGDISLETKSFGENRDCCVLLIE